ncbi:MarR family winged helix-turn-helix transcriptional regulator [Actinomycetes bacterium M1A6_2h]
MTPRPSTIRLANDAWEALFRAQSRISRDLSDSEVWEDLQPTEYGVLYALSTSPEGKRITELADDVLLSQPGLSRLIARLETRGLISRVVDTADGRASRVHLTDEGKAVQRRVGIVHAREVMRSMTASLSRDQLLTLRDLCAELNRNT